MLTICQSTLRAYSNIISYIMSIYARIYSEYVRVFSENIQNMPVCTQSVLRVFSKHTQREYLNIFEIYLECTLLYPELSTGNVEKTQSVLTYVNSMEYIQSVP